MRRMDGKKGGVAQSEEQYITLFRATGKMAVQRGRDKQKNPAYSVKPSLVSNYQNLLSSCKDKKSFSLCDHFMHSLQRMREKNYCNKRFIHFLIMYPSSVCENTSFKTGCIMSLVNPVLTQVTAVAYHLTIN
jgi:hypothetical protein